MAAGDVRDKLLFIFEILASYRLLLKPALKPSSENNQICWTIYTSGLKQHMPFMPVLGHFANAKATVQDYIRWEHRMRDEDLKEWHREIYVNGRGEGLDSTMENVVQAIKRLITSFTGDSINNATYLASERNGLKKALHDCLGITKDNLREKTPTDIGNEVSESFQYSQKRLLHKKRTLLIILLT